MPKSTKNHLICGYELIIDTILPIQGTKCLYWQVEWFYTHYNDIENIYRLSQKENADWFCHLRDNFWLKCYKILQQQRLLFVVFYKNKWFILCLFQIKWTTAKTEQAFFAIFTHQKLTEISQSKSSYFLLMQSCIIKSC